jgi:hypothetical protein
MTKQITVTEALSTLKLLDKKIEKQSKVLEFYAWETVANGKVLVGRDYFPSVKDAIDFITKAHDKVTSLMASRARLKGKVVASNAQTKVNIGRAEMTVAEAIEYKNSISSQLAVENRINQAIAKVTRAQEDLENRIQAQIENKVNLVLGNKKSLDTSDDTLQVIEKQVRKSNKIVFHDPLSAVGLVSSLSEEILEFLGSVDVVLTVSNSTTMVEYS